MSKHSDELKLSAVEWYEGGRDSYNGTAKKFGVDKGAVQKWVAIYKTHGVEGLVKKNGTYSGYFKISVVKYMYEGKLSARQTAAEFGIPSFSTVCSWERIYYEKGPQALYRDNRGRGNKMSADKQKQSKLTKQTTEDLIEEVQRLRMENAYLKKLNALVQEREKSVKKIK